MKKPNFVFSDEQRTEIAATVLLHWGDNMQTGYDTENNAFFLYTQEGPNLPVQHYLFYPDGTVTKD